MKKSMKLKTRIAISCCIIICLALFISQFAIWILIKKYIKEQAVFQGYQICYEISGEIQKSISSLQDKEDEKIHINYQLKQKKDPFNVCYIVKEIEKGNDKETESIQIEEIYNGTILNYKELSELKYSLYRNMDGQTDFEYSNFKKQGRDYIVFSNEIYGTDILLYRVEDITYVNEKMTNWTILMAGITIIVSLFTMVILSVILKRNLKPLGVLSDKANSMAKGMYNQRIEVIRNDEIGELGENFNRMAEAVESRTDSLIESEQRKTIFMGDLTHELKTPMTAISGYAQTLLNTKISQEEQEEALMYIVQQCNRLERMSKKIMRLLELSQSEELDMKQTFVRQVFLSVEKSCEAILKKKNITLRFCEQGECFYMDSDLMENVLVNLVDNAVKASNEGGEIIVSAYDNIIEVQDFGKGIPKDEQDKILEPFYMVDKSRSRKNGGAGLGLALVIIILKKHHVELKIDSEEGKGSRFILKFNKNM